MRDIRSAMDLRIAETHIKSSGRTNKEDSNRQYFLNLRGDLPFLGEIWNGVAGKRAAHSRVDNSSHSGEYDKSLLPLEGDLLANGFR